MSRNNADSSRAQSSYLVAVMLTGGSPWGARPKSMIGLAAEDPVRLIVEVTPEIAIGTDRVLPGAYATWLMKFANKTEVSQMFRRMAFNVFMYNRDDHAKNFAFLMEADGSWSLAPAYDLMYSTGIGGRHTTAIGGVDD